jgi:perosamine synthetase
MSRIPLSEPCLPGNAARYLAECIDTNMVSSVGPFVTRFEEEFARAVGARHAVACASGTSALHLALALSGAGPDRDVAASTFTFIASANAIRYTGARPLLVDSELRTWNLDPNLLHDEVSSRARSGDPLPVVVEVVHVLGHPADIEPILDLRESYGIRIVEDAAESLGATYTRSPLAGRHVGTIGELGCFSFNGNKVITTGGGGMIVTGDSEMAAQARHLSTQAKRPGREYVHDDVAYNYRLTNVAAALGLAQLEVLPEFLERKRVIAHRYRAGLAGLPLELFPLEPWASPSFWLCSVLLDEPARRDPVLDALSSAGIDARPLWTPAHKQPPYADAAVIGGHVAESLHARGISLPSSVSLTEADQERVIDALRAALGP